MPPVELVEELLDVLLEELVLLVEFEDELVLLDELDELLVLLDDELDDEELLLDDPVPPPVIIRLFNSGK